MDKFILRLITFLIGFLFGFILPVFTTHTLGEDSHIKTVLIKEQCKEYNQTTGRFVIYNLLKEKGIQ